MLRFCFNFPLLGCAVACAASPGALALWSTTNRQRDKKNSKIWTLVDMQDCFGGAWQRSLNLSPSFCPVKGRLETVCPNLVQQMTLVLAFMPEPFTPFRTLTLRMLHPFFSSVNYRVCLILGLLAIWLHWRLHWVLPVCVCMYVRKYTGMLWKAGQLGSEIVSGLWNSCGFPDERVRNDLTILLGRKITPEFRLT